MSYSFQTIGLLSPWLFIPRYFILFDVTVGGIVSLISLSDSSLVLYKKQLIFVYISNIL